MAPSPRKQAPKSQKNDGTKATTTTPRKIAQSTPTKATRTSPRKKAWASPPKALSSKIVSSIFDDQDFANLSNRSWAEITEEDEEILKDAMREEKLSKSESRRKGVPRKLNQSQIKPKFVKSLELTNEVFSASTSARRSSRIAKGGKVLIETQERVEISCKTSVEDCGALNNRKRCLSNASTINEDVSPSKRRQHVEISGKPARKTPRARLFNSSSESVASSPSSKKDHWEEPTLGWCTDDNTLKRRTREIERAKEKSVYQKYVSEIPIRDRIKGTHPRTPNKMINFSRRSWDTQIKKWKRSLYDWAGEEPSDSVNTSFCSYESDEAISGKEEDEHEVENTPILRDIDIPIRPETDCMASLLGKFDIDSRMGAGDESTLKASNQTYDPSAPVDFSSIPS